MDELHLLVTRGVELSRAHISLWQFSAIARRYRRLSLPIIFSRCIAPLFHQRNCFIPDNLWLYVRYGTLYHVVGRSHV